MAVVAVVEVMAAVAVTAVAAAVVVEEATVGAEEVAMVGASEVEVARVGPNLSLRGNGICDVQCLVIIHVRGEAMVEVRGSPSLLF